LGTWSPESNPGNGAVLAPVILGWSWSNPILGNGAILVSSGNPPAVLVSFGNPLAILVGPVGLVVLAVLSLGREEREESLMELPGLDSEIRDR